MEAREQPVSYSFGMESMKRMKVCPTCGRMAGAKQHACPDCGGRLPQSNLFQLYQQSHPLCPLCDTVLSDAMRFCPHCGTRIDPHLLDKGKGGNQP